MLRFLKMLKIKQKEKLLENNPDAPIYNNFFTSENIYDKYESVKKVILSSFLKVVKEYETTKGSQSVSEFLRFHSEYKYLYLLKGDNIKKLSDFLFSTENNSNFEFVASIKRQFYFDYCIDLSKEKDLIEFISLSSEIIKEDDFNIIKNSKETNRIKRKSDEESLSIVPLFYIESDYFYYKEILINFIKANTFLLPLILLQLSVPDSELYSEYHSLINEK